MKLRKETTAKALKNKKEAISQTDEMFRKFKTVGVTKKSSTQKISKMSDALEIFAKSVKSFNKKMEKMQRMI